MQIGEFSDDAYYQCPYTGSLFFGGIDGLLYLDRKVAAAPEFIRILCYVGCGLGGQQ